MQTTFLIDSNVLVYAFNEDVQFHKKARELVDKAVNGNFSAVIADKNLFEFFVIITDSRRVEKPLTIEDACDLIDFLVTSGIRVIHASAFVLLKAFELAKKYQVSRQEFFDMVLVATMLEHNINLIMTANDKHFEKMDEIEVINPFKVSSVATGD